MYQESLAEECQKFVSQYTSDVDSKSWRQVDLEEKIREADQKISSLRQLMETKSDNKISAFLNLSVSIAVLEGAKQKLQKILISLLTFNAVSPTIFLNSERYLLAVKNGFAQAAQSWDAASGTYLPPSSGTDLSWKQTISLGWQKRQAILNKVKNPKVKTLEEKLSKMSRAELEEEYGTVIQSYKRFLTMGQGDNVTATMDFEDVKLIWKRYNEVKDDHLGLLPSELAKVDPKFKKRIDAMDQEALEEAYPELKTLISMAHVNPYAQLFKSETERANYDYLLDRYFLLDSQKMLSWRDPAFQTKYDYYIIEEGIDPFTGKPATQEEINRAKDIKNVRAFTESLQLASTLYTSYVGYNQYYNKPYTTFSDVFSKVKGKVPFVNRKPVIPEVNPKVETNVKTISEPAKTYDREHILRNIEESKIARESSNFDQYLAKESLIKYPTLLDSKVKIVDKAKLPDWIGESFTDSNYRTVVTTEEVTLYRTFGGYSDAGGGFVTTTPASNRIQAKIDTALLPEWKNTRQYEAVIKIPKGVELNIGKVAPQTINSSGFILKGGADQVLLPNKWPLDWIVDIRIVPN